MMEVSVMNKTKSTVFWIIYSAISFATLIVAFPTFLFSFYPYSIIAVALYVATVLILSPLCLFKKDTQREWIKKMLFFVMLIPIITLAVTLILIGVGVIHFPG